MKCRLVNIQSSTFETTRKCEKIAAIPVRKLDGGLGTGTAQEHVKNDDTGWLERFLCKHKLFSASMPILARKNSGHFSFRRRTQTRRCPYRQAARREKASRKNERRERACAVHPPTAGTATRPLGGCRGLLNGDARETVHHRGQSINDILWRANIRGEHTQRCRV